MLLKFIQSGILNDWRHDDGKSMGKNECTIKSMVKKEMSATGIPKSNKVMLIVVMMSAALFTCVDCLLVKKTAGIATALVVLVIATGIDIRAAIFHFQPEFRYMHWNDSPFASQFTADIVQSLHTVQILVGVAVGK
jgi:hypothetical protein